MVFYVPFVADSNLVLVQDHLPESREAFRQSTVNSKVSHLLFADVEWVIYVQMVLMEGQMFAFLEDRSAFGVEQLLLIARTGIGSPAEPIRNALFAKHVGEDARK